jgi:hypothetical protein
MHDVWFTARDSSYPFPEFVRVRWENEVYEFALIRKAQVVTQDRCREGNADVVLDSFLSQLRLP